MTQGRGLKRSRKTKKGTRRLAVMVKSMTTYRKLSCSYKLGGISVIDALATIIYNVKTPAIHLMV